MALERHQMFPASKPEDGSLLLKNLGRKISDEDLNRLALEDGFNEPNCFPFQRIRQILHKEDFPGSDLSEYNWAISECGTERIENHASYMKLFVTAIYSYTDKMLRGQGDLQGLLFYSLLQDNLIKEGEYFARQIILLCEWLVDFVPPDCGSDLVDYKRRWNLSNAYRNASEDYYLLLTWLFARLYLDEVDDVFSDVIAWFQMRQFSSETIDCFDARGVCDSRDWLALFDRWPRPEGLDEAIFLPIIIGYDV